MHVVVPPVAFEHLGGQMVLGVAVMALALAVVLALCSEADAFVASSLTMLPLLPRLVFLVVGPAVDVGLSRCRRECSVAPSRSASRRTTLIVATTVATVFGLLLLGGAR